jgi:hypothetical protein
MDEAVFVFDTSCYINGQRDHLPVATFPSVWELVGQALEDGRVILPREVYREVTDHDDDVAAWIRQYERRQVEPDEEVQHLAGRITSHFGTHGPRNAADPFVLAEAQHRKFKVCTYEGRTVSGVPTRRWPRSMPGICLHFKLECCMLPAALGELGLKL